MRKGPRTTRLKLVACRNGRVRVLRAARSGKDINHPACPDERVPAAAVDVAVAISIDSSCGQRTDTLAPNTTVLWRRKHVGLGIQRRRRGRLKWQLELIIREMRALELKGRCGARLLRRGNGDVRIARASPITILALVRSAVYTSAGQLMKLPRADGGSSYG